MDCIDQVITESYSVRLMGLSAGHALAAAASLSTNFAVVSADYPLSFLDLLHVMQDNQQVLQLVLWNAASVQLLSRGSCVNQACRQAAIDRVKRDLASLMQGALTAQDDSGPVIISSQVRWMCKTAGPASLGAVDVSRAVLLETAVLNATSVHPSTAEFLAANGEERPGR